MTREEMIRRGLPLHETKPSQHRRANWQDYGEVGLYMVTLCVEGRQPVFGRLEGSIRAVRGTEAFPHLVPSALGRAVLDEELSKIHTFYPQVEVWQVALMPDHLHLLLYVREPLPGKKRLGTVVGAFMGITHGLCRGHHGRCGCHGNGCCGNHGRNRDRSHSCGPHICGHRRGAQGVSPG